MSHNEKAFKLKLALLQNKKHCQAKTLQSVKFLKGLISDEIETSEKSF